MPDGVPRPVVSSGGKSVLVARGQTVPGSNWQQYTGPGGPGIYIDVDATLGAFGVPFPATPTYTTILRGNDTHWDTTGATSVYDSSERGFRVYIRHPDGRTLTPAQASTSNWYIEWTATLFIPPGGVPPTWLGMTGSGTTSPADWRRYVGPGEGIYVDVDTSSAGFRNTPVYVCSLYGNAAHWGTTGGSSIYDATATGFRVYVRFSDGRRLRPTDAQTMGWYIGWMGQYFQPYVEQA
jgi:hypothetical protein